MWNDLTLTLTSGTQLKNIQDVVTNDQAVVAKEGDDASVNHS